MQTAKTKTSPEVFNFKFLGFSVNGTGKLSIIFAFVVALSIVGAVVTNALLFGGKALSLVKWLG